MKMEFSPKHVKMYEHKIRSAEFNRRKNREEKRPNRGPDFPGPVKGKTFTTQNSGFSHECDQF